MTAKFNKISEEIAKCYQRLNDADDPGEFNRNLRELAILFRLKWAEQAKMKSESLNVAL